MQFAKRNAEPVPQGHQRSRCGGCYAFSPRTRGDDVQMRQGICALTNGDLKQPGSVNREQAVCIFTPSKFKPKEFRQ